MTEQVFYFTALRTWLASVSDGPKKVFYIFNGFQTLSRRKQY